MWTTGKVGGALEFRGDDDHVDLGSPDNLNPSLEMSIVAWVKPYGAGRIVAKDSGSGTEKS